jgi:predicted TIM-barrel fold metal-dependent hydrolase
MEFDIIDAHVHCGEGYSFSKYSKEVKETSIKGAIIFPQAHDIYQQKNEYFRDNSMWMKRRRNANKHTLSIAGDKDIKLDLYPFKFIWNDFSREDFDRYFGVKWHRHKDDPRYEVNARRFPNFRKRIDTLRERNMPIIFEDEFHNIMRFITNWSEGINVIIPHLGFGNENYKKLEKEGVTDTSFEGGFPIELSEEHIKKYGPWKILFGSDYPYSHPQEEVKKIQSLNISDRAKKAISNGNISRLLKAVEI